MSDGYFRCGNSLVSADTSVAELLDRCGEPSSKSTSTHEVRIQGVTPGSFTTTEIWLYDRGNGAPRMQVTIIDGQIQSITEVK
jgi:hypothetical protein